jgi:hypothetical protein
MTQTHIYPALVVIAHGPLNLTLHLRNSINFVNDDIDLDLIVGREGTIAEMGIDDTNDGFTNHHPPSLK